MENIETVDELIETLERFRGYKLSVVTSVLCKVQSGSMFPENLHGKLDFLDSSCSDKELMLEFIPEENITYVK